MDMYDDVTPGSVNGVQFSEPGIADVVEKLVDQYTAMSDGGYLGAGFIRERTKRGYANLAQVIGSKYAPGFFWQSCGNLEGLTGSMFSWMTEKVAGVAPTTQMDPTAPNSIDPALDPRKGRREKADAYLHELQRSTAIRG